MARGCVNTNTGYWGYTGICWVADNNRLNRLYQCSEIVITLNKDMIYNNNIITGLLIINTRCANASFYKLRISLAEAPYSD